MSTPEILNPADSMAYVRANMAVEYPLGDKEKRRTFGAVPPALHKEIKDLAEANHMTITATITMLLDFWTVYGDTHEKELNTMNTARPKRKK